MAYKAHLNEYRYQATIDRSPLINTKQAAMGYGRVAATLGWGLDDMPNQVAIEFHAAATLAYNQKLQKLGKVAA